MSFHSLLSRFHSAILEGNAWRAAPDIAKKSAITPEAQLAIYIDGYRIRLTSAIRSDYPALLELLGDEAFDILAGTYIESHPSESFNLDRYPHGFAAFVREHTPDRFAADLAMLESAVAEVFMAAESEPLSPAALVGLRQEGFASLVLKPRPAARLLAFSYPVNAWLSAQREGKTPARPGPAHEYAYIYRHENNVQRVVLTAASYTLLSELFKGQPVEQALEAVAPEHVPEIAANLQNWFSDWMIKGFFTFSEG